MINQAKALRSSFEEADVEPELSEAGVPMGDPSRWFRF